MRVVGWAYLNNARWAWRRASTRASRSLYSVRGFSSTSGFLAGAVPWGSSVISPGATWPRRSRVAWTLELKPFANLLADWPRFKLEKLDCNLVQLSIVDCVRCGVGLVGCWAREAVRGSHLGRWRCHQSSWGGRRAYALPSLITDTDG